MLNLLRGRKTCKVRREDPEIDFKKLFRFTPESVSWLSEHFLGNGEETRGGALDSRTPMKIFLRYVADPGFQTGVAEDIGVSQWTVSLTVKHVAQK
nr:unnamed protein product [Callosobruchus chinensis]